MLPDGTIALDALRSEGECSPPSTSPPRRRGEASIVRVPIQADWIVFTQFVPAHFRDKMAFFGAVHSRIADEHTDSVGYMALFIGRA
jgi:hypothetical protein